ncbi:Uncharacterised protein [Vibrio cholerae]|nr:Uncharacterised protein [Vibrio cholerae]
MYSIFTLLGGSNLASSVAFTTDQHVCPVALVTARAVSIPSETPSTSPGSPIGMAPPVIVRSLGIGIIFLGFSTGALNPSSLR